MTQILKGIARRGNENWIIELQDLPEGRSGVALGPTWVKAKKLAEETAEHILKVPTGSVVVDLELDDQGLQRLVDEAKRAKTVAREAEAEAEAALGAAARALTQNASVRDVAAMLGYSHQYISRIAPQKSQD